ncbi:ornithine carbamoyltransferase [Limnochorda pilosa]|uniref:Ornithine carbamoyltransferase n=1 Tax=Limnochorda pilosa TaxID=1555112 RepID=A0A0K2SJN9_LIMPI|nr:ornithine carbamoyltransferase [Limnochorda pilosa]BAS27222.1 ornithine carbamoyltransferase [Limnochorda pilosa]
MEQLLRDEVAQEMAGHDFLTIADLSSEAFQRIIDVAAVLKQARRAPWTRALLDGRSLAMIFTKASTRTRVSFEVGMHELGGFTLFLNPQDLQLGRGETVADTARVLSRMVDGILIRTYAQAEVEELARHATVPVINGLTDSYHPTQVVADFLTLREHKGDLHRLVVTYVGDGNNVAHSLMLGAARVGMELRVCTPEELPPDPRVVAMARRKAEETGARIVLGRDPEEAAQGADALYTDVWASMGQEAEHDRRVSILRRYQVNEELLARARPGAVVLHCLPAHRGEEITDAVMDGPQSVVFDEAENRLHAQKAILALFLGVGEGRAEV